MQHLGTKTLYTKRLTLRRFTPEDAEAMFQNWANDPEVTRFLTWPVHKSSEESRALLCEWCPNYADVRYYHWAIVYGQPIGSIGAVRLSDQLDLCLLYTSGKQSIFVWIRKNLTSRRRISTEKTAICILSLLPAIQRPGEAMPGCFGMLEPYILNK